MERLEEDTITNELLSLNKRVELGPVCLTPSHIRPVGHKWVFVRKRNENNEVVRYKARLVAQGFSQRTGVDIEETYSPVMDGITFRYLISMAVNFDLKMKLMDVLTAYLYGNLDSNIYMKVSLLRTMIEQIVVYMVINLISHCMDSNSKVGCGTIV